MTSVLLVLMVKPKLSQALESFSVAVESAVINKETGGTGQGRRVNPGQYGSGFRRPGESF